MNYYNEFEPKAAAWLRELAAAGQIAPGTVDHRSITDIQPHELHGHTQHHFFAGIAGWAHALDLAGWSRDRPVWTASLPCQPFSTAGQGRGASDERHLWPVFFRLVREHRPQCIFGEQVAQAIGFDWLDGISADLESEGYAVGAHVLGAHSVGAPHRRQRLYWMACATGGQRQQRLRAQGHELQRSSDDCSDGRLADPEQRGQRGRDERGLGTPRQQMGEQEDGPRAANEPCDRREDAGWLANSERPRLEGHTRHGDHRDKPGRERADAAGSTAEGGRACSTVGDPESGGCGEQRDAAQQGRSGHADSADGPISVADSNSGGSSEGRADGDADGGMDDASSHGTSCGHTASEQSGNRQDDGVSRPASAWDSFTIIPCRDGKSRRIESGTFPLVDGLPRGVVHSSDPSAPINAKATAEARVMRLRGYGNAIVPELAAEFIRAAMEAIG